MTDNPADPLAPFQRLTCPYSECRAAFPAIHPGLIGPGAFYAPGRSVLCGNCDGLSVIETEAGFLRLRQPGDTELVSLTANPVVPLLRRVRSPRTGNPSKGLTAHIPQPQDGLNTHTPPHTT